VRLLVRLKLSEIEQQFVGRLLPSRKVGVRPVGRDHVRTIGVSRVWRDA
jgi:hypothetical protein